MNSLKKKIEIIHAHFLLCYASNEPVEPHAKQVHLFSDTQILHTDLFVC